MTKPALSAQEEEKHSSGIKVPKFIEQQLSIQRPSDYAHEDSYSLDLPVKTQEEFFKAFEAANRMQDREEASED